MLLLLAKLFVAFLEFTSRDAEPAWLPIVTAAVKCPVTLQDGFVPHRGPSHLLTCLETKALANTEC